jgi:hypothetical protein
MVEGSCALQRCGCRLSAAPLVLDGPISRWNLTPALKTGATQVLGRGTYLQDDHVRSGSITSCRHHHSRLLYSIYAQYYNMKICNGEYLCTFVLYSWFS